MADKVKVGDVVKLTSTPERGYRGDFKESSIAVVNSLNGSGPFDEWMNLGDEHGSPFLVPPVYYTNHIAHYTLRDLLFSLI
ncbi:hypothetical protein, partial [Salmonella enterica]|uniref:hypothetical protein n=1 Tax=Salmonella enterica TaxID=28901 RepID=UPI002891436B